MRFSNQRTSANPAVTAAQLAHDETETARNELERRIEQLRKLKTLPPGEAGKRRSLAEWSALLEAGGEVLSLEMETELREVFGHVKGEPVPDSHDLPKSLSSYEESYLELVRRTQKELHEAAERLEPSSHAESFSQLEQRSQTELHAGVPFTHPPEQVEGEHATGRGVSQGEQRTHAHGIVESALESRQQGEERN